MKKSLLAVAILFAAFTSQVNAQVLNYSFETWGTDTFYLAANSISNLPADTVSYPSPTEWTTSNLITDLDSIGTKIFVTQTNDAYHGASAIQMITDSIKLPVIPGFPAVKATIPGFAVNGKFPINPQSLLLGSGTTISPMAVKGAGQPMTQRLSKVKGYYKYTPVFNPNTSANDTCLVWATLRNGLVPVADAIFKSTVTTSGYQPFEVSFSYASCTLPDTLVIFLAASVPNVSGFLGGSTALVSGSVFKVDSIYYEDIPGGYNFPPIARNDFDTTTLNTAKTTVVKLNDDDCNDAVVSLTVTVLTQPLHGTAAVVANAITYTPNNGYLGLDSFSYTLSDGSLSSTARVRFLVYDPSGISESNLIHVAVYPVPASNEVSVQFENTGRTTAKVYDMLGNLVLSSTLTQNINHLNIETLSNGFYAIQLMNENNQIIARSKFSVSK